MTSTVLPNAEEVRRRLKECIDWGESYTEGVIMEFLLSPEQQQLLFDRKASLSMLMNGQIDESAEPFDYDFFFKDWNAKLGVNYFGFSGAFEEL